MSERITVFDEAGNKVVLGPNDHHATGGEGSVYIRSDTVYKVYLDPAKAVRARMDQKVPLLRALQHPGVAAPTGVLRDKQGSFVGVTLRRVEGDALCALFTNTWRDAHQVTDEDTKAVVLAMREVVGHAHAHSALLVDGNEMNWLVRGRQPVAIDVDSWQLPGFAATAIMESIRDPRVQMDAHGRAQFTEGSDWFSWAVVTFQLWAGIHPYKGTHPDFGRADLAARMKAGASVFDSRVRLPGAARSVNGIPSSLRQWYRDVFEAGLRTAPPSNWQLSVASQTAPKLHITRTINTSLRQERLLSAGGKVLAAFNGFVVAQERGDLVLWDVLRKARCNWSTQDELRGVTRRQVAILRLPNTEVVVQLVANVGISLRTQDPAATTSNLPSRAVALWQSGARVFGVVEGVSNGLVELQASVLGGRSVLTVDKQWAVNALSTQFLKNCFVQDCLGMPFIGVLEGSGMVQLRAPALKNMRVLQGIGLDRHNVWLTAVRKSDGQIVRMRLQASRDAFEIGEEDVVADADLDGALLQTGVGVIRLDDDLRVSKGANGKTIPACGLSSGARLYSMGSNLGLFEGSEVSKLSLV